MELQSSPNLAYPKQSGRVHPSVKPCIDERIVPSVQCKGRRGLENGDCINFSKIYLILYYYVVEPLYCWGRVPVVER